MGKKLTKGQKRSKDLSVSLRRWGDATIDAAGVHLDGHTYAFDTPTGVALLFEDGDWENQRDYMPLHQLVSVAASRNYNEFFSEVNPALMSCEAEEGLDLDEEEYTALKEYLTCTVKKCADKERVLKEEYDIHIRSVSIDGTPDRPTETESEHCVPAPLT
ncbi:hypothetical protein KIPB_007036 [Kipferlia bialata]|uniref:Uncharacterized protein n=1 Tax=Kipferlia bialata TaxID=797122 RepID=A0A9K3GGF4_9EUKA|nr:hypothetical protein KIPB_004251 [Kipferlia bialata]GIQ85386.1 hypothetical protein KIPB_007036 [Kipferlia bialata]|eukprot:g4251.t1